MATNDVRYWQVVLRDRLEAAGYRVAVRLNSTPGRSLDLDLIVAAESLRFGRMLAGRASLAETGEVGQAALVLDLAGTHAPGAVPVLQLRFNDAARLGDAARQVVAGAGEARVTALLDGVPVAEAQPMLSDRAWLSRGLDELLARTVSLLEKCVRDFEADRLSPIRSRLDEAGRGPNLLLAYPPRLAAALGRRLWQKARQHGFYWRVGYRLHDGPGVAERGTVDGPAWTVLPDDGERFYADPFAFSHQGRDYLFLEEYPYALGRGRLAVAELGADGQLMVPQTIVDEPFHLSYPQVFARDGEIWMLPETSAERQVILYRAEAFPQRWVRHAVLLDGVELSDATLLERDGRLWLFGAGRDGLGSASDMLVVYCADRLEGPWRPHARNPILIDKRAARPGGAFVKLGAEFYLPVQDGSQFYGGGLGLARLDVLNENEVRFAPPRAVAASANWSQSGLHTLNRSGRLEVIDGFGELRKGRKGRKAKAVAPRAAFKAAVIE